MSLGLVGFDLLHPQNLAACSGALLVAAVGAWGLRARARAASRLVAPRQLPRFLPERAPGRARWRVLLATTAALFVALALVGPVRGYTEREIRRRGLDLVVCLDTSRSMLVRDLRPDRLTRAKREIQGLIDRLRGDRIALLAFAGDVRRVAPLTHDRAALKSFLETVDPDENRVGGTDLGGALEAALSLFDGRTGAHEAIVLLTDGEDLEGRGRAIAEEAGARGIQVYVVGMGTEAGGKIPIVGPDGRERFVTDSEGQEVVSRMDGSTLRELARSTGGEYLAAAQSATPLEELYDERIAHLEGREYGVRLRRVPHDRFQWFLVVALGSMFVEAGLRERRRAARRRA